MMRLMLVGSKKIYAIENYYSKYLNEQVVNLTHFASYDLFIDYYLNVSLLKKILFKLGLSNIFKEINKSFRQEVEKFKPDIIWVFKGFEILPESLQWAKKKGIKLINYNPDNPFIFTGSGSGNKNITDSIGIYDLHFTYNSEVENELQKKYRAATAILPFGYEISNELYTKVASQEEIIRACFIGNPDKQRAELLLKIVSSGIKIDVYGNDWKKFINHENITVLEPVYGNDLWMVLGRYRVQLNMMRIHNLNSHNMRSFEIPGVGGIQVAPFTSEHVYYFEDKKEIFLYKTPEECSTLIKYLLSISGEEASKLKKFARQAVVNKKYSYQDRATGALLDIKRILIS